MIKYESYKDSGVKWLGEIPSHWEVGKMREFFSERKELSKDGTEKLLSVSEYTGITPSINEEGENISRSKSLIGYKKCFSTDLVINIMLAWKRGLAISLFDGIVSPSYCVFSTKGLNPKFANYLLRTDLYIAEFKRNSTGIIESRLRMYPDEFKNIHCIKPPLEEQLKMVDYLDKVTRDIDKAIEVQQKLIDALNERKQIIITNAVIKGLDPTVQLKDSGIDWIGQIPEHWRVRKIKYFASLKSGKNLTSEEISPSNELNSYPVYGGNGIRGYYFTYNTTGEYVIIGRQGALCGNINYARGNFWATDHAVVCSPIYTYPLIWFGEVLKVANLNQYATQSAQPGLSVERIKNIYLPCPSVSEMFEIAAFLEKIIKNYERVISNCGKMISLLQERKQIIINDVVTGKKKVI